MRSRGAFGLPACLCLTARVFFFTLSLYEVGRRIWKDATDDGEWDVDNSAFLLIPEQCADLGEYKTHQQRRKGGKISVTTKFSGFMLYPYPTTAHFLYSVQSGNMNILASGHAWGSSKLFGAYPKRVTGAKEEEVDASKLGSPALSHLDMATITDTNGHVGIRSLWPLWLPATQYFICCCL
ncbi:hypothetical protein V8F33_008579 [Rhypophila sp. PSN 637]